MNSLNQSKSVLPKKEFPPLHTTCYNTIRTPALCIHDMLDMFIFLFTYLVRHLPYARFIRTTLFPYTIPFYFPYAQVLVLHMTPSVTILLKWNLIWFHLIHPLRRALNQ